MRKDSVWHNRTGGYIETTSPTGYDVLINGSSKYLNFNLISGETGYGIRDNAGTMQFKNSGGAWTNFGAGGGGAVDSVNGYTGVVVLTTGDIADSLNKRYVTDANLTTIGNQSGTNTGDNAVNTLYSGLVSNATHTGDATGATALTVVKIQGKDFPTLGAGDDQKYPKYVHASNAFVMTAIAGAGGDVVGPASAVNDRVVFFDGVSGKLIKDSGLTLSGSNTGDQTTISGNAGTATTLQNTRTIWGQNFNGSANVTGTLALGASDLTLTGSIGATGARATKGWFTDLESTNAPTAGGVAIPTISSTNTFTNKRITKRTSTEASSATPTINVDNVDFHSVTALAVAITSFTTNLSGTPTTGQLLWIAITDNGTARAITWGASFQASGTIALPTTTVISTRLDVGFVWTGSIWRCIATA